MATEVVWAVYEGDWSMRIGVQEAFNISHVRCELGTVAVPDKGLQAEQMMGPQAYGGIIRSRGGMLD